MKKAMSMDDENTADTEETQPSGEPDDVDEDADHKDELLAKEDGSED